MYRWASFLVVLMVAALVGWAGYSLGVSHGLAQSGHVVAYHPWGFGFGFFFPFLFFFLFLRLLFWGGMWRRGWHYGPWRGVPPAFDEWHARAHERMKAGAVPRSDV
jgi:hypothetical protein